MPREDICKRCNDPDRQTARYDAPGYHAGTYFCGDCARAIDAVHGIKPSPPALVAVEVEKQADESPPEDEEKAPKRRARTE